MAKQLLAAVTVIVLCSCINGYNITDRRTLKNYLLVDRVYDKTIRPVVNQSNTIKIEIAFAVTSIVDFDLVSGHISTFGYIHASWTDEQLTWNPFDFNGISKVQLSQDLIWTPGLKNGYDIDDTFALSQVQVFPNGRVVWLPINVFNSICIIDVTYYPYDEHTCQYPFFSLTGDGSTLQFVLLSNKVNLDNFIEHGEWSVVETTSEVFSLNNPQLQVQTSSFVASLKVRRRPRFAVMHTYFPLLLLTCVNILTFIVPLDKGERVSFAITLLLALIFFTSSLSDTLPKNSLKTSYFSTTMTLAICSSTLGVMLSIILVKIDAETIRPVPRVLYQLTSWYKYGKKSCPNTKNTVTVLKRSDSEIKQVDGDSRWSEDEDETVTWSEVAHVLNKLIMVIYSVLLIVAVVTLAILNHSQ